MKLTNLIVLIALLARGAQTKICKSVNVRNNASNLSKLQGCTVVEGYVQIVLMERANETDFEPWSFPELREITDYLLFYRVKGLRRIGQLFPNLVRIGGANLFIDFGLVVHEMFNLQEIGLTNLKEISRGSIIITNNPSLCYVDTINWELIARWNPSNNYVAKNKDASVCPRCHSDCVQGLCWSSTECQIQAEPPHCHPLCVGGCSSPGPRGCNSCQRVLTSDNLCVQNCPSGTYEYLSRRCITKEECMAISMSKTSSRISFLSSSGRVAKFVVFNGTCTDSCPSGYEFDSSGTGCVPCRGGKCQKWCPGMSIENIGDAQVLRGCTHIQGSLEISIRTGKPKIVSEELENSLGSIEEIESYLKVVRSFPIVSLNFLRNLTTIHGKSSNAGFGDNYSLLVLENENIQELWDWDSKPIFKILSGKVFFHYNPKLCLQHIDRLLSVIHHDQNVSNLEVGKDSNGDKFPCNATEIDINVQYRSFNLIQLSVPYLQINYDAAILRYVIYLTKDPYKNITMFDDLDQCSDYGWKTKDISVEPRDGLLAKNSFHVNLTDLEPYTQYAFYVTTYTEDRFGAKSPMYHETTFPTTPSEMTSLAAFSNKSSEIVLQWEPPKKMNGKLKEYIITWSLLQNDRSSSSIRNYCKRPMTYFIETETSKPVLQEDEEDGNGCCSHLKKPVRIPKAGFERLCSNYNHCPFASVNSERDQSLSCESCFYDYVYKRPFHYLIGSYNETGEEVMKTKSFKTESARVFETRVPGNSTEYLITDVLHFREYLITVRACRESHPNETDKSVENRCSKTEIITIRTQKDEEADRITGGVSYQVLNGTVYLAWETPSNPNDLVVAFEIEHQHVESANINPISNCIAFSEHKSNRGTFSILGLAPGGYKVRVRAVSLSGKGPFTEYLYFNITSVSHFSVYTSLIVVVVLCLFIIVVVVSYTMYRKKKNALIVMFTSVNPDYHYVQDHWEILRDDVELVRELGAGSFGKVYEGVLKPTNTPCAVKTVNDDATEHDNYLFLSEASVMKSFSEAYHIVRLLGVVSSGLPPLVVMELMSLGDLKTYLRSTRETNPPLNATMINMALQIADGMAFMEAKKYVHRDLAARNCMVSTNYVVKVGDFGMTRDVYETDYYRKNDAGLLPIRWMAPESLKDGVFTSQSDVWSFGVVLWEIVTLAEQPYQGSSNDQVLHDVIEGRKLTVPRQCPDALKHIMHSSWKRKPSRRMTLMQIVTSLEYFHDDEFKKVAYYYTQEAADIRKTSSDYVEMRSVEDPLLGEASSRASDPPKPGSMAVLLSKMRSFNRGERLSRIEEAEPSSEE